jgi:DHA2 family multidrug resistance protein-like MFS transporter
VEPGILIVYRLDGLEIEDDMTTTLPATTSTLTALGREAPRVGWRGWAALVVLMLPVLLVSVDNTVLSFALPQIALDLEPTATQQLWIIDAYPLVLASLLVTMGTLGDRFGRRRMLLIGATGFGIVSALAAFAPSAEWLIVARASMGVFGAMLMPSTLSLLRSIFRNRDQRRMAIAVWAAGFSAGAALGPVVGGLLLEHFAWGSVFLMAVPVLVPLLILVPVLVPESRDPQPGRFDPLSVVLSLLTMVPIVYAIKEFAVHGTRNLAPLALILAGLAFGVLFVRRQNRLETPMLDMALFRRWSFTGSVLVNLLSVIGLVGFLYFVAQHLQLVLGLSPMDAGLSLVPGLATMIVAGIGVVPIAKRVAPRVVVPAALAFSVTGYVLIAITASSGSLPLLVLAFVSLGMGIGAAETVSNELILASAPSSKAGAASAVSETAYELGAVLGTTIMGGILAAFYGANLLLPAGLPAGAADAARETLAGAVAASHGLDEALGRALRDAAAHAFDAGVGVTALIGAALIVVAAVIAALTLGGRPTTARVEH